MGLALGLEVGISDGGLVIEDSIGAFVGVTVGGIVCEKDGEGVDPSVGGAIESVGGWVELFKVGLGVGSMVGDVAGVGGKATG